MLNKEVIMYGVVCAWRPKYSTTLEHREGFFHTIVEAYLFMNSIKSIYKNEQMDCRIYEFHV